MHLSDTEQKDSYSLLKMYEDIFDGTLGSWPGEPYNIQLKANAKPYHAKPYPIPKIHENTMHLVKTGVLKKVNCSEWTSPVASSLHYGCKRVK